jgi:hypothetical protein
MRKFSLALMMLALCAVLVMPAMAQDAWAVYLFNGNTGELVRVNPDGTQAVSGLGLEQGAFVGSSDMSFSKDGNRLAFCAVTYPQTSDNTAPIQPTAKFYLRDIAAQNYLLSLDFGIAIGCRTGQFAFNEDETQVAVGRINYYPGDPAADTTKPVWQITVLDIAGGITTKELNSTSPSVSTYETLSKGGILPYIQYFANNQIIFAEVPYGIGGGAEWNAYIWDLTTDAVTQTERWGNFSMDVLQETGEIVWTAKDEARPAGSPGGPVPDNNIVKIADKTGEERVIFHSPDWVLLDAKFINGGQQVAIQMLSSFNPDVPDQPQTIKWIALDRAGLVSDLVSSNGNPTVAAAPGGYITLDQQLVDTANGQSQFTLTANTNGTSTPLWTSAVGFDYWELAWVTPAVAAPNLAPFPSIV